MAQHELKGKWALITGASSGFGRDYAELLAEQGMNLVLTARREDRLRDLENRLNEKYSIEILVSPCDLSVPNSIQQLYDSLYQRQIEIEVLINNAGFGLFGEFVATSWEKTEKMLQVDILALTQLTKLFADDMVKRKSGYILLVSSIGAYQPTPTYAAYSAAKSYVLNFGEALNFELRHTGVKVAVLSPGITATEFLQVSGQKPTLYQRIAMMKSRPVAKTGIRALLRGNPSIVPGWMNKVTIVFTKLLPRSFQTRIAYLTMNN